MHNLSYRLLLGCSAAALVASIAPVLAQDEASEQVVVTGTSIRGVAPVGSNLISVTAADIKETGAQTVSQLLVNVPALTSMGAAGQGENHTSYYQPTIHQLGSSLSNATLVLIDSHRAPAGDTNHPVVDPNIVPVNMIERVEVLADGSSATYGSEAIAGVINFITRKKFDGVQLGGQLGIVDGQQQLNGNILVGTTTDKTSVLFAYQYSHDGAMANTSRPYTNPDQRSRGGTNFGNFNCDPATIQDTASGSNYFASAASATILNSATSNSPCSSWAYGDILEKEVRNSVMVKGIQELAPNLTFTGEAVWATLRRDSTEGAGTLQATAWGAGAQANPFFTIPPAVGDTATKQTIRWDATQLLGLASNFHRSMTAYADGNLEWRVNDNWTVDLLANVAHDDSQSGDYGLLNAGVATLALNGTTQTGGSTTAISIPGTTQVITQLPLTNATALDVWNPAATNRTSSTIIAQLKDSATVIRKMFEVEQLRLSTNGTLFQMPAGDVKLAVGFEQLNSTLYQTSVGPNGTGAATTSSRNTNLLGESRKDTAGFVEVIVPVISPEMNIPLVQKFEIDLAGRYDSYTDVGNTSNPKASFNWDLIDGLRLRGNWSTSFVAPALDVAGNAQFPGYYVGNTFQSQTNNVDVPIALFPAVTQIGLPGSACTATTCNVGSVQGIVNRSGDANVKPIKGRSWSLGIEFTPDFLPGLVTQLTYWNTQEIGGITGPNFNNVVYSASLAPLVTFTPGCATPAQIATLKGNIPQTGALPACALYLFKDPNSNYLNLKIGGIDASIQYNWEMEGLGSFKVGTILNQFLQFDEAYGIGAAGAYFSVLGTTGSATSFPSVSTQMRSNIGWALDDVSVDFFMNYTGAYRNWGSPVTPITLDANKNPNGGGDHVAANITFDLHLAYTFSSEYSGEDEFSINIRNVFDRNPPFYNSSVGYDTWVANPYGRIVQLGLTAKL